MIIKESRNESLVGIWWYTDNGEFWDFSTDLDSAENDYGYLQYSKTKNHLNLWKTACDKYITDSRERTAVYNKGYKSIERGRVVYNIRTQCYEVICSKELVNDINFRDKCVKHFNLSGNRVDFEALNHYYKQDLTGNPEIDKFYLDY
jgi:hypothetical protein